MLRFVFLSAVLSFLFNPGEASAQHGRPAEPVQIPPTAEPVSATEAANWRADLQQLPRALRSIHPDAFGMIDEKVFLERVAVLDARIPGMARHEIIVGMARLMALVRDGHTSLWIPMDPKVGFVSLPMRFGVFEEGVFVIGAGGSYADLTGTRVVAFEQGSAAVVLDSLGSIISHEARMHVSSLAPDYLNKPQVLHALGFTAEPAAVVLTLERDGHTFERRVAALTSALPADPFQTTARRPLATDWADVLGGADLPLFLRTDRGLYWWEYVPGDEMLYVQLNAIANQPGRESMAQFFAELPRVIREKGARSVALDLRNNSGGNGFLNVAVVRAVVQTVEIDDPLRLFVMIGRNTYSAAQMLVNELEHYTRATFVGEPTGSTPNSFGDHGEVVLSNSGITLFVSSAWHQTAGAFDERPHTVPRFAAAPTFAAYSAGDDVGLEVIRRVRRLPTLAAIIDSTPGDSDGALRSAVVSYGQRPENRYVSLASLLNTEGYRLLRNGDPADAVRVFRLNVELHPDYTNGYDSLGEAYEEIGDPAAAIEMYREVVRREPGNSFTREKLERLSRAN